MAPQYCGALGKQANGQVVVTTHYVDPYHAWPVDGQLYLPESWATEPERCRRAGIPPAVGFQTKPAIALGLMDAARSMGVPFDLVVSDSGYGDNPTFLEGLEARHLHCAVSVACDFGVRLPAEVAAAAARPVPPKQKAGRPRRHPHPEQLAPLRRGDAVLGTQPEAAWQTITWRLGSDGPLTKQFCALRVHRAVGETTGPEGWLVGERPLPGKEGERKYYWSDLPADTPLARLVEVLHRRPSVERGYEDGKDLTGLDAYAARKWASFHRHLVIELLVLSWLTLQRPRPEAAPIVVEPRPVASPDEPFFPLRTGALSERRPDPPADPRVPGGGTGALAHSLRPTRPQPTRGSTAPCRLPGSVPWTLT